MTIDEVIIRPAEIRDVRDINTLRRMPGIVENLIALPSETIASNEKFIANVSDDDHIFAAEISSNGVSRVIGLAGLHCRKLPRMRHTASIGIMVHVDFHRRQIGSKLMNAIIDLADNWLMLKRVDLTVYPENTSAIKLYEKFGFVREGISRYASIRNGAYADLQHMARYHHS